MKLALIYDPNCPKLTHAAYSQTYRDMFLALAGRYEEVQHVNESCSANDISADHIVFFDIHSSHDIEIRGIENHKAVKIEYFNDPHQKSFKGKYTDGTVVHKLGAEDRTRRANARGVQYIICPYENGFYKYIAPWTDAKLMWFPTAPRQRHAFVPRLEHRKKEVLANGHCWYGENGFRPYAFRTWAYQQDYVSYVQHSISAKTPQGDEYQGFLMEYAGALALCDTYVVPKYVEIPMAGCLCFAQYQFEYENMGFHDGKQCIYVTKKNLESAVKDFLNHPEDYQAIAERGRDLVLDNWTARHFAEFVYGQNYRT